MQEHQEKLADAKNKQFRIIKKANVGVSTDDSRMYRSGPSNFLSKSVHLTELNKTVENLSQQQQNSKLASEMLLARVQSDREQYDFFMEKTGIMRFYDGLWDLGVDSLQSLSKVTIEEFNQLFVPAGTQIKIQRELKRQGILLDDEVKDMGTATDQQYLEEPKLITSVVSEGDWQGSQTNRSKGLSFGIKVQKVETNIQTKTSEGVSCGTEPVDFNDMPLNVEEGGGPGKIMIPRSVKAAEANFKKKKTVTFVGEKTIPVQTEDNIDHKKENKGSPFSFFSIGGGSWENNFDILGLSGGWNAEEEKKERILIPTSISTEKREFEKKSCFSCYKMFEISSAYTHKLLKDRVRCWLTLSTFAAKNV